MSKVLLVEDDINLREIYAARLSAEGHELVLAADGEEALSKAVSEKPQLILLDIMMPKISGFDVLDILRSTPETENTKVVMLSALSQESDKERGEQLGVDKYLIKSQITLEDVVETVKELVQGTGGSGDQSTSIVTTSTGRLPDENSSDSEDGQSDQQNDQAAQNVAATKQSSSQNGKAQSGQNQAADEINDIDSQMQQNTDNQQSQSPQGPASDNVDGQPTNDQDDTTAQDQQDTDSTSQSHVADDQQKTASE